MMKEIKCPHCGEVFAIDETNYNSIVKQVRDHVFEEELKKRESEYNEKLELQKELLAKEVVSKASVKISEQETEIEKLKNQLKLVEKEHENELNLKTSSLKEEINTLNATKQSEIDSIKASKDKEISEVNFKANEAVNELKNQIELLSNVRLFKDSLVKIIGDIFDSYDSLINLFGGQCQII